MRVAGLTDLRRAAEYYRDVAAIRDDEAAERYDLLAADAPRLFVTSTGYRSTPRANLQAAADSRRRAAQSWRDLAARIDRRIIELTGDTPPMNGS